MKTSISFTRRSKAATIVPLALISGVWSVSLVGLAAGASKDDQAPLPDGTQVPSEAIEAPASVPIPGLIAPGVPQGSADAVVSGASTSGIPSPALAAYQRGAQIINSADKTCNMPWELIAAIGRVESDHGRYGGNVLTAQGVSKPGIYGPVLNGSNNTQAINDTDGGQLDKDTVYDRAVGPMQFIPSTWSVVKVDADGDAQRNPQDIDDAGLATAVYLCSGSDNLSSRAGQEKAVYRYNHSRDYVNLVLRIMEAYSQGEFTAEPSGSYGGTLFTPNSAAAIQTRRDDAKVRQQNGGTSTRPRSGDSTNGPGAATGTSGGSTGGSGTIGTGSTGGSSGGTVGTGSTGGTSDPVAEVTKTATAVVTKAPTVVSSAAAPVANTIDSMSEAVNFCSSQLSGIVGGSTYVNQCASRILGKTTTEAAAIIPNTLSGLVGWLT